MKLTDRTHGLKRTALEQVRLDGESLGDLTAFWDESARVDAIGAIADSLDERSFETSGLGDASRVREIAPPNARILEIGPGVGRIMQHLSAHADEVHGVDISAEMVRRGSERLAHLNNVHFHKGNGYDLGGFNDETFDVVYSYIVFQHVPKTIAFNYLTEVHRVLRPGGKFRLHVPNLLRPDHFNAFRHFAQPYFVEHPFPMNFYTPVEVFKLFSEAGLVVDDMSDEIMVLAHKASPADDTSGQRVSSLDTTLDAQRLLAELEQARGDLANMRRVYDHPLVGTARKVRRLAKAAVRPLRFGT